MTCGRDDGDANLHGDCRGGKAMTSAVYLLALLAPPTPATPATGYDPAIEAFGLILGREDWPEHLKANFTDREPPTLDELRTLAGACGLATETRRVTLDELAALDRPVLVFWPDGSPATVILYVTAERVQAIETVDPFVVPRGELDPWFPVEALVPVPDPGPAPRVRLSEPHADLGTLPKGATHRRTITIRNDGELPLELSVLRLGCASCTEVRLADKVVPAGTETTADVIFLAEYVGAYGAHAILGTNDPMRPWIYLTWTVDTPADYQLSPERIRLVVDKREPIAAAVYVTLPAAFELTAAAVEGFACRTSIVPWQANELVRIVQVELEADAATQPDELTGTLRLRTSDPDRPHLELPVQITVRPDVRARPEALFYGRVPRGERRVIELLVARRDGKPMRVTAARGESPEVDCGAPVGAPDGWRIAVAVTPAELGLLKSGVLLTTDVAGEPEVRVGLILWCDPPPEV